MRYLTILLCISLFTISNSQSNWAGIYDLVGQYSYNATGCFPDQLLVRELDENLFINGTYPDISDCEELGLSGEYSIVISVGANTLEFSYALSLDLNGTMSLFPANNSIVNLASSGNGSYFMFIYEENPGSNTYNWAGTYDLIEVVPFNNFDYCSCIPNTLTVTENSQTQVITITGTDPDSASCPEGESIQNLSWSLPITHLIQTEAYVQLFQSNNSIVLGMGSSDCGYVYQGGVNLA